MAELRIERLESGFLSREAEVASRALGITKPQYAPAC